MSGYRGSGGGLASFFSDPLNSAPNFSKNWAGPTILDWISSPAGNMAWGTFSIQAGHLVIGVGGTSGNTNSLATAAIPAPMLNNGTIFNASQQFAQYTFLGGSGTNAGGFLAAYFSQTLNDGTGSGGHEYSVTMLNVIPAASPAVQRVNTGVAGITTLLARGTLPVVAANDVWRFSVDTKTTPGTTIIRVTVNGVLQATINDNAAGHSTFGVPCLLEFGGSVLLAENIAVSNFSCGLGL